VHLKNTNVFNFKLLLTVGFLASSFAFAGPAPRGPGGLTQEQISAILGENDKTADDSTAQYLVTATLKEEDGTGSLNLKERQSDGTYVTILTDEKCPARGSNGPTDVDAHRVKTPKGLHAVYGTVDHAIFRAGYDADMPFGTFFWDVTVPGHAEHNPIGVHRGPLDSESHACIRTKEACAETIMKKAQGPNLVNTSEDRPKSFPDDRSEHPRTITKPVMDVLVKWI
jgi:hypothetical protein